MKNQLRCGFLFLSLLYSWNALAFDDEIKVSFEGAINVSTCKISTNDLDVDLGVWLLQTFAQDKKTQWVEFDLTFQCPSAGSKIAGQLQGTQASDGTSFAIETGNDTAKGMGLEIEAYLPERKVWETQKANTISELVSVKGTSAGTNTIKFRARYKQLNSALTAGKANASVTFVIQNN
ncbi:TPA: fimbrial protein [Providencia alcalifaciens]